LSNPSRCRFFEKNSETEISRCFCAIVSAVTRLGAAALGAVSFGGGGGGGGGSFFFADGASKRASCAFCTLRPRSVGFVFIFAVFFKTVRSLACGPARTRTAQVYSPSTMWRGDLAHDVSLSLEAAARTLAALVLAHLPRRLWSDLDVRFPVRRLAPFAALLFVFAGFGIGVPGFLSYMERAGRATTNLMMATAQQVAAGQGEKEDVVRAWGASMFSLPAFLFFTPLGWLTLYLVISGALRAISAGADAPFGDPILTGLDNGARALAGRRRVREESELRLAQEGPAVPDVLLRGREGGAPEALYALVCSRRKPDWAEGAFVLTEDARYRIGRPFDHRYPGGLRIVYPLHRVAEAEVMRRMVRYELPPLAEPPT
jgi:hypothetical protein